MGNKQVPFLIATGVQLICALGVSLPYWIYRVFCNSSLVSDPVWALGFSLGFEGPVVIGLYSLLRNDPHNCSYWKAVERGLLGLPSGAILNAFGAIVLGAPLGLAYWTKTINWSLLMSLFTVGILSFVPAVCVFGSPKKSWQRLLIYSKMTERLDYMISFPAHGAIIGGWIGAWPMPLDWDRPWQEWPICVTYGSVTGYFLGLLISLAFPIGEKTRIKSD